MKKALFTSTLILLAFVLVKAVFADMRSTPRGEPQALATADYGGMDYSTSAFPVSGTGTHYSTVAIPNVNDVAIRGVFAGVIFSSGSCSAYDWVDVYDATTSYNASLISPMTRLYNMNGSTATGLGANGASCSGFSGPPKPLRFRSGLITKAGVATYNMITTLFYRETQ